MATQVPPSKDRLPQSKRQKPTADLETPEDYKDAFRGRSAPTKYADPCQAASKASLDCLERAHYNRAECTAFFKAYKECKKKWMDQRWQDKRAGRESS